MPKENSTTFSEVNLEYLVDKVSKAYFTKIINPLIIKSYQEQNTDNVKTVDVGVLYNPTKDIFHLHNTINDEFLIEISRSSGGIYYCKPLKLIRARAVKIIKDLKAKINKKEKYETIYDQLNAYFKLKDNDKLSEYFYYLAVILVDEFNLDAIKSSVIHYDSESLILDGFKDEYVNTNLDSVEIGYMISVEDKKEIFKVVKINNTANSEAAVIVLKLEEFYLDMENGLR